MIKTKVIKRYIQTLPIQNMIMRTDHLAESVQFELVNWTENIDYGAEGWQWFIYYRTTVDPPVVTPITYSVSEDGNSVFLLWEVDHNITKRSGNLDFQIRGKRDTDKGLIEWNSSVATINLGHALDPDDHDTDENILEWYLNRMEQLAQSGIADITAERDRAIAAETDLNNRLTAEIERSITKDNELQKQIDKFGDGSFEEIEQLRSDLEAEIYRSTQRDAAFSVELSAEANRAQQAEENLSEALANETLRATQAEKDLQTGLTAESDRAQRAEQELRDLIGDIDGNIADKLQEEINRATQAENQLREDLNKESQRATEAESQLKEELDSLDTSLNEKLQAEIDRATEAEGQLDFSIQEEAKRAKEAESQLSSDISAEKTRAEQAEKDLQTQLTAEVTRAEQAEAELDSKITTETERATQVEEQIKADLTEALNTEIERATNREDQIESDLTTAIETETSRAEGREQELETLTTEETNRATLAERNLQGALESEVLGLTNKIEAEEERAVQKETELQTSLDTTNENLQNEITRATQAEGVLDQKITEVSADLGADIQRLVTDLANETTTRQTETTNLRRDLNTAKDNITELGAKLQSETDRSTAKDAELTEEIGSLTITQIADPAEGYSFQYYLSLTRDGTAQQRGATISIPVTDAVVGGGFDEETNELILNLANGDEIRVPFGNLIQYYNAGDGIQIVRINEESNEFRLKLDTVSGTQGILSASADGLKIDLSKYSTTEQMNAQLALKQDNLKEEASDPESDVNRYLPSIQIDEDNTIYANAQILSDLLYAYNTAQTNYAAIVAISSSTVNGETLVDQSSGTVVRRDVKLYSGTLVNENVLIADGTTGKYKDSGFTIKKSVPEDAKFTDTLYYVVTEGNPEGLFTWSEKQKLHNIEERAQVNVQSDWNATEGDAYIKNKPVNVTPVVDGFMSAEDKSKLDNIEAKAEVNQNAFSNVVVGDQTVSAGAKTDTFTLVGDGGTTVTADPATKTITIKSEDLAQADWDEQETTSPAYIKNKPGLATPTEDGFMSAEDKARLDELDAEYLPLTGGTMTGPINSQSLIPTAGGTFDVGSDSNRYRSMYATTAYHLGTLGDGKGIFYNAMTGGFDFIC